MYAICGNALAMNFRQWIWAYKVSPYKVMNVFTLVKTKLCWTYDDTYFMIHNDPYRPTTIQKISTMIITDPKKRPQQTTTTYNDQRNPQQPTITQNNLQRLNNRKQSKTTLHDQKHLTTTSSYSRNNRHRPAMIHNNP